MWCKHCLKEMKSFELLDGSKSISIQVRLIKKNLAQIFCSSKCARTFMLDDLPDNFWEG